MKRINLCFAIWILIFILSGLVLAAEEKEEFKFELREVENKPYRLGGYGEFRPVFNVLDRDAALYKIKFYNRDEGKTTEEYNFKLLIDGSYEQDIARLFLRLSCDLNHTYLDWKDELKLYEALFSLKPSPSFALDIGKKTLKWGKGYAWNPVAFITALRILMNLIWPWKVFG